MCKLKIIWDRITSREERDGTSQQVSIDSLEVLLKEYEKRADNLTIKAKVYRRETT